MVTAYFNPPVTLTVSHYSGMWRGVCGLCKVDVSSTTYSSMIYRASQQIDESIREMLWNKTVEQFLAENNMALTISSQVPPQSLEVAFEVRILGNVNLGHAVGSTCVHDFKNLQVAQGLPQ